MCVQSIIKFFKCGCCKKGADSAPEQTNTENPPAEARNVKAVQMHAVRVDVAPAPTLQQQAQRGHHKYTSTMVDLRDALRTPMVEDDVPATPAAMAMS